jgi:hypothetical protein
VEAGPGGAVATSEALEVRGTTIDSYRMLGRWQFVLVVDDVRPLAAATVDLTE